MHIQIQEGKNIKKTTNIAALIFSVIVLIVGTGYLVLQSKVVQTAIISALANNISKQTNADISIGRVNVAFFRKVVLDDVYMSDLQKDTLIYIEKVIATVDSLSFSKKKIVLKAIALNNPVINFSKNENKEFNFAFLSKLFTTEHTVDSGNWRVRVNKISIKNSIFKYVEPFMKDEITDLLNFKNLDVELSNIRITPDNYVRLNIERLGFDAGDKVTLVDLSTQVEYHDSVLILNQLYAHTMNTQLGIDTLKLELSPYLKSGLINDIEMDLLISELDFGFNDIAFLVETFQDNMLKANFSGRISGSIDDLNCKGFELSVGNFTKINGDIYLNGLPNFSSTYIFFDLKESYANLNEIRNIDLPPKMMKVINDMPAFLNNLGEFSYSGNFTGFIDDFVAYGTAYSNLGKVSTDVSFRPHKEGSLKVNGHITADHLDIGRIFQNEILNKLSFNGDVKGTIDDNSNFDLVFNGLVNLLDINNYTFSNIDLKGFLNNELFNGTFSVSDPYLQMEYTGKLDLTPELPVFEFLANIDYVNLESLNLFPDLGAMASVNIDANFEGNSIDNVKGELVLAGLKYGNAIDTFEIDKIVLRNIPSGDTSFFTLRSDVLDGDISGHYNFSEIGRSLFRYFKEYLPSSYAKEVAPIADVNHFDYYFNIKNIDEVVKVFYPNLYIEKNIEVYGHYKPAENSVFLETQIPFVRLGQQGAENLYVKIEGDSNQLFCSTFSEKLRFNEKMNIYNLSTKSTAINDVLKIDLDWNNFGDVEYSGYINTITTFKKSTSRYPHVIVNIQPSTLVVSDSLWLINESMATIDSSAVFFDQLILHSTGQRFSISGGIAKNNTAVAFANIDNVDISLLEPYIGQRIINGKVNGHARLVDIYNKFMLNTDLTISDFKYNEGELGDLYVSSNWDNNTEELITDMSLIKDRETVMKASGIIDPKNSKLDMNLLFDRSPVPILDVFIPSVFNNYHGLVDGEVHVHGNIKHLMMDGQITPVSKAGLGISYLNTVYSTSDPVLFSNDSIIFSKLRLKDHFGNTGVLNGVLTHRTFNNMKVNLSVETDKLLVMDTSAENNKYFYGSGFAMGKVDIVGNTNDIVISGNVRTEKGTNLYIPFESSENAVKYNFVEFINTALKEEKRASYDVVTSGLNMNFDVDITPDAKVQIIFKSQIGDIIKGEGSGNLQVKIDKNYNINLYGNYIIEQGDYLFTLQNVINKRFSIERGSSIEWIGDPYDAIIDIDAVYKVKTSLHDLIISTYENIDLSRRIQVDCYIKLTESLIQPRIAFAIELPTAEERVKDQVNQLIATPEDVNKQIISLLMMGRFYTPEYFAGRATAGTGVELVGSTASELISNQLSNWLSQITDVMDFGLKFRRGNEISDAQVEFALSTQFFNDRVTLNGNVANNLNTNSNSNNNSEIIGDFDANIKLTDNGKLQFKAYHRSNDNLIYDTAPYTQGIGFSYREEFNSLNELLKRYTDFIFRRNRNKKKNQNENIEQ